MMGTQPKRGELSVQRIKSWWMLVVLPAKIKDVTDQNSGSEGFTGFAGFTNCFFYIYQRLMWIYHDLPPKQNADLTKSLGGQAPRSLIETSRLELPLRRCMKNILCMARTCSFLIRICFLCLVDFFLEENRELQPMKMRIWYSHI